MDYYALKNHGDAEDFVTITQETESGYMIRIVRDKDGYEEVINEFISKELFESCLRTGYLTKVTSTASMASIA